MRLKPSPVTGSRQEDAPTTNVSPARNPYRSHAEEIDALQGRLGRLLGGLASRVTLAEDRAAEIWRKLNAPAPQ
jgi:hypothetical protein